MADPKRLPFAHGVARVVRQASTADTAEESEKVFAPLRHTGAPPGVAARGGDDQLVAGPYALREEPRERRRDGLLARRREAHVVYEQHEGAGSCARGADVGRCGPKSCAGRRRFVARPKVERLERDDLLRLAVLGEGEVLRREPADGPSMVVEPSRVHR